MDNFVWDIITNGFYNVVGYSLPRCDLRYMWNINIQYMWKIYYKYTIIQINAQYHVIVSQVFADPVSVFILLGFSS